VIVAALAVTAAGEASTVVLKGGKRLEAASVQRQGNYFIVKLAGGRVQSYPVAAVDLEATRAANQAPAAPAPTAAPGGPHSPFFGAQASRGQPVFVVTDQDVEHVVPPDEEEEQATDGQPRPPAEGQVVLMNYSKQQVEGGVWEITATVLNSGSSAVASVVADVRLLDAEGAVLGSGTAALDGTLAPAQQAAVTARVASATEPIQIGFSFRWQAITPVPTPTAAEGGGAPQAAPAPARPATQAAASPQTPSYAVPLGASPTTMAPNPNVMPSLLEPPTSLQVARPVEAPKQPS